jgi:sugar phosphate isomerase/epimerase
LKIGLSTSSVFPLKLEEAFKMAKDANYDGVEVMISNDRETRDVSILKSLEDKYQLPVLSFHAPVLLLTHFVWGTDPAVKLSKTADLAKTMGSKTVVVHPPFAIQKQYSSTFLSLVKRLEERTGVLIAVENMFPWKVNGREAIAYKPSWETITNVTSNITLDFSHSALSGLDALGTVKELGEKVSHIHLCDGFGTKTKNGVEKDKIFDEHLPPGAGNQPVRETLEFLAASDWHGSIVSEINTRKYKTYEEKRTVLAEAVDFTNAIFKK